MSSIGEMIQNVLKARGIPSRRVFVPVTEFPHCKPRGKGSFRNSYKIYEGSLCLPCSTLNSREDIYRVCAALKDAVRKT